MIGGGNKYQSPACASNLSKVQHHMHGVVATAFGEEITDFQSRDPPLIVMMFGSMHGTSAPFFEKILLIVVSSEFIWVKQKLITTH